MSEQDDLKQPSRILLVDDHQVVRAGLSRLLELEEDLVVVGEAGTAEESIDLVESEQPDLVLMDVRLPGKSGVWACGEITSRFPNVKVLVLTSYADDAALAAAMSAGASGFLLKSARTKRLVSSMRSVLAGETIFVKNGVEARATSLLSPLSSQERVLARYLAEGLTNREIAGLMGLAEKTVKNYVSSILTKLEMARRSEAAAFMARVEAMAGSTLVENGVPDGSHTSRRIGAVSS